MSFREKVILWALCLGPLGVHKFMLRQIKEGLLLLACFGAGFAGLLFCLGVLILAYFKSGILPLRIDLLLGALFGFLLTLLASALALGEALFYQKLSDEQFRERYLVRKRKWF